MIYGSIPAGGRGTRLQPIGFSKELAYVGGKAIIEHLIERMVIAGIKNIFINTASDKTDLVRYLSSKSRYRNYLIYLVRARKGLQDGILAPEQFLRKDDVIYFGLPDTIWFPKNGYSQLLKYNKGKIVLGLFDSGTPERFDAVDTDIHGKVLSVDVKVNNPKSKWTWGIGKIQVSEFPLLHQYENQQKVSKTLFGKSLNQYAKYQDCYAVKFKDSRYLDIGVKEDYEKVNSFIYQTK